MRQGVLAASLFIAWYEMWTEIQGNLAIFGQFLARVPIFKASLDSRQQQMPRTFKDIGTAHSFQERAITLFLGFF